MLEENLNKVIELYLSGATTRQAEEPFLFLLEGISWWNFDSTLAAVSLHFYDIRLRSNYETGAIKTETAIFDRIVLGCAPETVPPALLDQLAIGGRLLAPVGHTDEIQVLTEIERTESGFQSRKLRVARFVPLIDRAPLSRDSAAGPDTFSCP